VPGRARLAVTVGDPRGIGPEVVARALADGIDADVVLVGPDDVIGEVPAGLRIGIGTWGTGKGEGGRGPSPFPVPPSPEAGRLSALAVESAARLALDGDVDAIVTGPVHKASLHAAGFRYPGLTELLAHLAGDVDVAMMLAVEPLRVVLVTTHLPLREVPAAVTTERVVATGRIATAALRRWWGIAAPRLAVCALNPHAG
jgi:4-hydroxythreonine-4-phosphate dehydrogenase